MTRGLAAYRPVADACQRPLRPRVAVACFFHVYGYRPFVDIAGLERKEVHGTLCAYCLPLLPVPVDQRRLCPTAHGLGLRAWVSGVLTHLRHTDLDWSSKTEFPRECCTGGACARCAGSARGG